MNFKTTLVLLGLVTGVAATLFFLRDPEGSRAWSGPLFPALVAEDVRALSITDARKTILQSKVDIRRHLDHWVLESPELPGQGTLRCRTAVVQDILQAFQEAAPLRLIKKDAAEGEMGRFGLGPELATTVSMELRGGKSISLEFGSSEGASGVTCRRGSEADVFEVDREVKRLAVPGLDVLKDPRLLFIDALAIEGIEVEKAGRRHLSFERFASQWFVRHPFDARADQERLDVFRNTLAGLTTFGGDTRIAVPAGLEESNAAYRLEIKLRDQSASIVVRLGMPEARGVPARVGTAHDVSWVDPALLGYLDREPGEYRDRTLFPEPAESVVGLVFKAGKETLELRRDGGRLAAVLEGSAPARLLDPVEQGLLVEAVRNLKLTRYVAEASPVDTALELTLKLRGPAGSDTVDRTARFGPANGSGERPFSISGQPGLGWVRDADLAPLRKPYWKLIERVAGGVRAYYRLVRFRITDQGGRAAEFGCRLDGNGELAAFQLRGGTTRDVPSDLFSVQKGVNIASKLVLLTVGEFVADGSTPEMGFQEPFLKVEWTATDEGSPKGIPENPRQTTSHHWIIGAPAGGDRYYSRTEDPLGLVSLVEHQELMPFFHLLDWAHN